MLTLAGNTERHKCLEDLDQAGTRLLGGVSIERMGDHYRILGLSSGCNAAEIRSAFRRLARQFHPDLTGLRDSLHFREVLLAYQVLANPETRAAYDRSLGCDIPVRILRTNTPAVPPEPLIPQSPRGIYRQSRATSLGQQDLILEIFHLLNELSPHW